jgi:hypothetical protein
VAISTGLSSTFGKVEVPVSGLPQSRREELRGILGGKVMMVPDESGRSPCRVDVHPWDRARGGAADRRPRETRRAPEWSLMSSIERRLERVAEAVGNSGCTCDGQGSVLVVRYVGPGDPLEEPGGKRRPRCLQHPPRIRFERFDRTSGAWVEANPKLPATNVRAE